MGFIFAGRKFHASFYFASAPLNRTLWVSLDKDMIHFAPGPVEERWAVATRFVPARCAPFVFWALRCVLSTYHGTVSTVFVFVCAIDVRVYVDCRIVVETTCARLLVSSVGFFLVKPILFPRFFTDLDRVRNHLKWTSGMVHLEMIWNNNLLNFCKVVLMIFKDITIYIIYIFW